ncbi:MAG: zinc ribbon domain-containing protein [Acidobacteria bacterium]|nr:zinc ribbon domain-containing protein [Acidobacteriota bacterium]
MPMFEYRCDGCRTRSEILVLAGDVVAGDLSGEGSGPGGMGGFDN